MYSKNYVPPTTNSTIVFPCDFKMRKYDSSLYSPALTDGRASKQEIDQVFQEIEVIRAPYVQKMYRTIKWYVLLSLISLAAYLIVIITNKNKNTTAVFVALGIYLFIIMTSTIYFVVSLVRTNKLARNDVQDVIDRVNHTFTQRGLKWVLPVRFPRWIELHKEYIYQAHIQPGYVAPAAQGFQNYGAPPMQGYNGDQFQQNQQIYNTNYNNFDGYNNAQRNYV